MQGRQEHVNVKRPYNKPTLTRCGLLRVLTRFSF